MDDITQYELIAGLQKGEETAYKELYRLHYRVLCAFAYSYVSNSFIAESLVSDVIFNLWEGRDTLVIKQSLRAYLMKAVKNTCINYLAHCSRHNDLVKTLSSKMENQQQIYYEQDGYPLCSLLEKELEEQIEKSISSLSELSKEIFWMSRNDKMKYEEIAHEKGLTVDIVKYHIRLVLSRLRNDLKDYLFTFLFVFFPF